MTVGSKKISYNEAKKSLKREDVAKKRKLAAHPETEPEILYYLASDPSIEIRRDIAENSGAPIHADEILSEDEDDEVRAELARKIARLVPNLRPGEGSALLDRSIVILERLAKDQLAKVRKIVAEELKHATNVPKDIIKGLAGDEEIEVAAPILEYSPLLSDTDMKEILAAGIVEGGLACIAKRRKLSEDMSDSIAGSLDIPALTALLTNKEARIREETMDQIIRQAKKQNALHGPLSLRPDLSVRAIRRIADFVASSLVHGLIDGKGLDNKTAEEILDKVRERIAAEPIGAEEEAGLAEKAADFYRRGAIDDSFILDQIAGNRRRLLIFCLAELSKLPVEAVKKILVSKSGRAVTALAWQAGLKMRTAYEMQIKLALVPPSQLVPAKDGVDYPFDEKEVEFQLSYFIDE